MNRTLRPRRSRTGTALASGAALHLDRPGGRRRIGFHHPRRPGSGPRPATVAAGGMDRPPGAPRTARPRGTGRAAARGAAEPVLARGREAVVRQARTARSSAWPSSRASPTAEHAALLAAGWTPVRLRDLEREGREAAEKPGRARDGAADGRQGVHLPADRLPDPRRGRADPGRSRRGPPDPRPHFPVGHQRPGPRPVGPGHQRRREQHRARARGAAELDACTATR